jgi:hypothetical protein
LTCFANKLFVEPSFLAVSKSQIVTIVIGTTIHWIVKHALPQYCTVLMLLQWLANRWLNH